jgi:DNA-binding IclR family transcriptional regulator
VRNTAKRDAGDGAEQLAYHIASVDHALRALLLLHDRGTIRVSELAEYLEIGRSTAHRTLGMLQYHGFVSQDSSTHAYRAGPLTLTTLPTEVDDADIRTAARPHLEALWRQLNETIHLAVLEGNGARFIDGLEARQVLRVGVRTGMLLPAHCTAVGKALLAKLPPAELRRLFPRPMAGPTPKSIVTLPLLQAELRLARRKGYATNFGESHPSLTAVAVSISDMSGRAVAAVAIAAPQDRLTRPLVPKVAAALRTTADSIGAALSLAAEGSSGRATSGALPQVGPPRTGMHSDA